MTRFKSYGMPSSGLSTVLTAKEQLGKRRPSKPSALLYVPFLFLCSFTQSPGSSDVTFQATGPVASFWQHSMDSTSNTKSKHFKPQKNMLCLLGKCSVVMMTHTLSVLRETYHFYSDHAMMRAGIIQKGPRYIVHFVCSVFADIFKGPFLWHLVLHTFAYDLNHTHSLPENMYEPSKKPSGVLIMSIQAACS